MTGSIEKMKTLHLLVPVGFLMPSASSFLSR